MNNFLSCSGNTEQFTRAGSLKCSVLLALFCCRMAVDVICVAWVA